MNREVVRVVVPALGAIALLIAGLLVFEWFIVDFAGINDMAKITFDLREARACSHLGPCAVVPMSMIKGSFYPALAAVTFWGGIVFALLVLYQAGTRVLSSATNESVTRAAHLIGVCIMLTAVCAGYLFGPDFETGAAMGIGVERGWGPSLMLLGLLGGHVALYFTREGAAADPPREPVAPVSRPRAPTLPRAVASPRVPLPIETPPRGQPTVPRPPSVPPVAPPRTKTPPRPQPRPQRASTSPPMPDPLRGKIKFAMVTGDVSVAGIDARREDGGGVLVMWRDVVGLVVRRLPPELEGHPFVDVVSTAGMTLRVLPWSKLTGQSFAGEGEAWIRAFVKLVAPRCTESKLDRATQAFIDDDSKRPAQLPNLEMLAKHDQALA